jgi:hypothetical protein
MVTAVFAVAVPGSVSAKPPEPTDIEEHSTMSIHVKWKDNGYEVTVSGPSEMSAYLIVIDKNGEKSYFEMKYNKGEYSVWISKEIAKNKNDIFIALINASDSLLPDEKNTIQALSIHVIKIDIKGKKDNVRLKSTTVLETKLLLETVYEDSGKTEDNEGVLLRDIVSHGIRKGAGPGSFVDLTCTIVLQYSQPDFNVDSFFDVYYKIDFPPIDPGLNFNSFFDITYRLNSLSLNVDSFFDITYKHTNKGNDFFADSFFDVSYKLDLPSYQDSFFDVFTGLDYGLPYPGRLHGDFPADSFFDVFYEVDFAGSITMPEGSADTKGTYTSELSGDPGEVGNGAKYVNLGIGSNRARVSGLPLQPFSLFLFTEGTSTKTDSFFDVFTKMSFGSTAPGQSVPQAGSDSFFDVFTQLSFMPPRLIAPMDSESMSYDTYFDVFTEVSDNGQDRDRYDTDNNAYLFAKLGVQIESAWQRGEKIRMLKYSAKTLLTELNEGKLVIFSNLSVLSSSSAVGFLVEEIEGFLASLDYNVLIKGLEPLFSVNHRVNLSGQMTPLGAHMVVYQDTHFEGPWYGGGSFPDANNNPSVRIDSFFDVFFEINNSDGDDENKVQISGYSKLHTLTRGRGSRTWGDRSGNDTGVEPSSFQVESNFDVTFDLEGAVEGSINEAYEVSFEGSIELQNDVEKQFGDSVNVGLTSGCKLNTWVGVDDLYNTTESIINLTHWFETIFNRTSSDENNSSDLDYFRMRWDSSAEVEQMTSEDNQTYGSQLNSSINISFNSPNSFDDIALSTIFEVKGLINSYSETNTSDADSVTSTQTRVSTNYNINGPASSTDSLFDINVGGIFSPCDSDCKWISLVEVVCGMSYIVDDVQMLFRMNTSMLVGIDADYDDDDVRLVFRINNSMLVGIDANDEFGTGSPEDEPVEKIVDGSSHIKIYSTSSDNVSLEFASFGRLGVRAVDLSDPENPSIEVEGAFESEITFLLCSDKPDSGNYNFDSFFNVYFEIDAGSDDGERECPECGAEVDPVDETCSDCGAELGDDENSVQISAASKFHVLTRGTPSRTWGNDSNESFFEVSQEINIEISQLPDTRLSRPMYFEGL